MKKTRSRISMAAIAAVLFLWACGSSGAPGTQTGAGGSKLAAGAAVPAAAVSLKFPDPPPEPKASSSGSRMAVLAGGCFWGMEGVFEKLEGVIDVVSGYSGGDAATANYAAVSSGTTAHAESVRILYDPSRISYGTLLKVYFSIAHDPTELDFQGPDVGRQYRSVIFYADEDQKRTAEDYIRILDAAKVNNKPIVTEVVPLSAFYAAEDYHQDFMRKNPDYPYILAWDAPKVRQLLLTYPGLVAAGS